ncbi:MAG: RNA polymerase subunit sigma [Oscillospiraceae bacterium]|nr:RNA polymerase subunit sigma [Oscillospiraceae bacterium]
MSPDVQQLISRVISAKSDSREADALIADYMPFIRSETAKFLKRQPEPEDDELSIAMFAFYEAICSYSKLRGAFLKYAALQIKSRLIDNYRREKRNSGQISLNTAADEDQTERIDTLADPHDAYAEQEIREATKTEIAELTEQMTEFGVSMTDIAENAPKQGRTLTLCKKAVSYARSHPDILEDFLRTKRVPLAKLAEGAGIERKPLERHRKYLVAVLLICTNGYEILRGHIMQVLKGGEQA